MPLTTIDAAKEQALSYAPLLLAVFTFPDASVLRLSTAPLKVSDGGFQYGGNDYLPRIHEQMIDQIQAMSEQGVDLIPSVNFSLSDADKFLWTNYENAAGKGFKGARVRLTFIYWDADTSTFSSDLIDKFAGICNAPSEITEDKLTVHATHLINLQKRLLPVFPIQKRCPKIFPRTAAQRAEGANNANTHSIFFPCGYGPDAPVNPVGTLDGASPFTDCDYTKAACQARGMYDTDSSGRVTKRFGGIQYEPPGGTRTREYTTGQWLDLKNLGNEARYGDYIPQIYGRAWVEPPVIDMFGDGNSTRGHALLGYGQVDRLQWTRVIVNDTELPPAHHYTGSGIIPNPSLDPLLRWNWVTDGGRQGAPDTDAPYDGQNDPLGSIAVIEWVVYKKVQDSASVPRVRVLMQGLKVRIYTTTTIFTEQNSSNPVWVILDLLLRTNFTEADLDIQSFIDMAGVCNEVVSHVDQTGAVIMDNRYSCSMVLRQRRSAAEILRVLRQSFNAILIPNSLTSAKTRIFIKRTLADQQPSPVAGSNYDSPVASITAAGVPANGYVAYHFNESTIIRESFDGPLNFKITHRPISDTPNRIKIPFADRDNEFAASSLDQMDTEDIARAGQEVAGSVSIEGLNTFDQAKRVQAAILAESLRGNVHGDTRNTRYYELKTTSRGVRLSVGQIAMLSLTKYGIANQLIRILKIQPGTNYETVAITAAHHDDDWYTTAYGQNPDPRYGEKRRGRVDRPPFGWRPATTTPGINDPLFDETDKTFQVDQVYGTGADGAALASVLVTGALPINAYRKNFAAPLIALQGTAASGAGQLQGDGRPYFAQVCAIDAEGLTSAPSLTCLTVIATAGSNFSLAIPVYSWDPAAVGYRLYIGTNPNHLTKQQDSQLDLFNEMLFNQGAGPSLITFDGPLKVTDFGVPDVQADRLRLDVSRIRHSGVFGDDPDGVSANTLTFTGAGFALGVFTNHIVSVLAARNQETIPFLNLTVTGNGANSLSVTPDPVALGINPGDIVVMRSRPTVISDATGNGLRDATWLNPLSNGGLGLEPDAERGYVLLIISGPGRGEPYVIKTNTVDTIYIEGEWLTTPTADSIAIVVEPGVIASATSAPFSNEREVGFIQINVAVENYLRQSLLARVYTLGPEGRTSLDNQSPIREAFLLGDLSNIIEHVEIVTSDKLLSVKNQIVFVNTSGGNRTITMKDTPTMGGRSVTIKKITSDANVVNISVQSGDTTEITQVAAPDQSAVLTADAINRRWRKVSDASPGGDAGTTLTSESHTLTAPTTNITATASPVANTLLQKILTQDATGGRQITWAANLQGVSPDDINTKPAKVSRFLFIGDGSTWNCISDREQG